MTDLVGLFDKKTKAFLKEFVYQFSLDNKTESEVMKSVYDLTKELTIIIVAHRISSLEGVSRLIELDNGRIIEQ